MESPHPLDYAPVPPNRIRFWIRRTYKYITLVGIIAAAIFWGPGLWKRTQMTFWNYRCIHYSASANHVIFEWDSSGATKAESSPELVHWKALFQPLAVGQTGTNPGTIVGGLRWPSGTPAFLELHAFGPNPIEIPLLNPDANHEEPIPGPSIFGPLHKMRFDINVNIHSVPSITGPPSNPIQLDDHGLLQFIDVPPHTKVVRLFAARVDPANPSHFTIDMGFDQTQIRVDGWLLSGGSTMLSAPHSASEPSQSVSNSP
jgi:hypothetical protein